MRQARIDREVTVKPIALLLLLAILLAACSGGDEAFPRVTTLGDDPALQPIIASSELVVGDNRFVFGLLDAESRPIADAKVALRFFDLNSGAPVERATTAAVSQVPSRDAGLQQQIIHTHADGSRHIHVNASEQVGVYTARVRFDRTGDWGVEMAIVSTKPKLSATARVRFNVAESANTPAVGEPAPRSRNLTAADVSDLAQIDSSAEPSADMHTSTIADAVAAGRPAVVLFAVPGYCTSQMCGPEYEIMRKLFQKHRSRVEFIHVEFYKNPASPDRVPVDAAVEWRLRTEPWFFVIDAKGLVAAKFEGPTGIQELEEAIQRVAASATAP